MAIENSTILYIFAIMLTTQTLYIMSHQKPFFSTVFTAVAAILVSCNQVPAERQVIFDTADSIGVPYRIPALASFDDGTLTAIVDYRHCRSDIGFGRVDIHARISGDNGRSWGDEFTVIEGTGVSGAVDCGFGDPAIVRDSGTDELLLITVCGETVYGRPETNRQNPNRVALLRSNDKGRTWSGWKEITEDVYSLFDGCSEGCVHSCFVGSGKIFQSRVIRAGKYYRIYAALCARPGGNRVIYSDDFGHTWNALGGPDAFPARNGDEPKCEELPDGSVILSSRAWGGRIFNIYRYEDAASGAGSWGKAAFSGQDNNGCTAIGNACNGEILIVPAKRLADRKKVSLVLQSVPLGEGRKNVGIWYRELPEGEVTPESLASGWSGPFQVSGDDSAYSTMILQSDGLIGFFYEEHLNADITGYDMVYEPLSIETITGGEYAI